MSSLLNIFEYDTHTKDSYMVKKNINPLTKAVDRLNTYSNILFSNHILLYIFSNFKKKGACDTLKGLSPSGLKNFTYRHCTGVIYYIPYRTVHANYYPTLPPIE